VNDARVERRADRRQEEDGLLDRDQAWNRYERDNRRAQRQYEVDSRTVDHRYDPQGSDQRDPDPRYT
jgi:hypothetical protein